MNKVFNFKVDPDNRYCEARKVQPVTTYVNVQIGRACNLQDRTIQKTVFTRLKTKQTRGGKRNGNNRKHNTGKKRNKVN